MGGEDSKGKVHGKCMGSKAEYTCCKMWKVLLGLFAIA